MFKTHIFKYFLIIVMDIKMWIGRKKKDDGLLQMKHRPFYYL